MDIDALKQGLQGHFTDGLVTIVGSGLSVAEGLPSMRHLGQHLLEQIPQLLNGESKSIWEQIATDLENGADLEATLLKHPPDGELGRCIAEATSRFIAASEKTVIEEVIEGRRNLRFSRLLKHMLKPESGIPVITTNYDRLIEVAAEASGFRIDTLFVGHNIGLLDEKGSRNSLCTDVKKRGKFVHRTFAKHVKVFKPHGSLDWYSQEGEPVRCPLPLAHEPLIITPGYNKFRTGYDRPFDVHRESANREIDNAARYLIIGYGFHDDHLQTHLEPQLLKGRPAVLITHTLSRKARQLVQSCDGVQAITAMPNGDGALIVDKSGTTPLPGIEMWDLGEFISEVLEP